MGRRMRWRGRVRDDAFSFCELGSLDGVEGLGGLRRDV